VAASNNQTPPGQLTAKGHESRPRIVVVAGPTAVGKTALGIELALEFNGEVVNADSRYLYRRFDIGVAKPDPGERREIPHHLIDILPPDGQMTLARYQELALDAIEDVLGRNKLPILVGGTPLYVNAVVEGWQMPRVPPNPSFRAALEADALATGIDHFDSYGGIELAKPQIEPETGELRVRERIGMVGDRGGGSYERQTDRASRLLKRMAAPRHPNWLVTRPELATASRGKR